MKQFDELTTEEKWDIVYDIIHYIDESGKYNSIYVNIYQDEDDNNILVFDDWDSAKAFNKLVIEKLKENEIDISLEEQQASARTNGEEYFVDLITEDSWTYSDEGFLCDECQRWHYYEDRNGVGYVNYYINDGGIVCSDCVNESDEYTEMYLEELIDDYSKANTLLTEDKLYELGFEKFNNTVYENGMYGDNDSPQQIMETAQSLYPNKEFLFSIRKIYNPFTTQFDLYTRDTQLD